MQLTSKNKFSTVDQYFDAYPDHLRLLLEEMQAIIRQVAPKATEVISYNMPAFKQHGVLVWYAAYKDHIGFYPSGGPIVVFKDELAKYKTSKGAIQFPLDKPLPKALIKKIVKYRIEEDQQKADEKKLKKKR